MEVLYTKHLHLFDRKITMEYMIPERAKQMSIGNRANSPPFECQLGIQILLISSYFDINFHFV